MQTVRTTPGQGIDQRQMQVVLAQKPRKCAHRGLRPLFAAARASRGEACGNCGRGLNRLLIEGVGKMAYFAEALGTHRPEAPGRRGLERHQPAE